MRSRAKELTALITATCVGLITGLIASAFNGFIVFGTQFIRGLIEHTQIMLIMFPIIAALLTAALYKSKLISKTNGMGMAQVLFEMKTTNSQLMRPQNVFWNSIATLVTLILGMTAGRFGPITHLGTSIGVNIGKFFKLSDDELRLMMGCGAAGAIATVFNLPFFAAIFVMEVMFREQYFRVLAPLIITSVISNRVSVYLLGDRLPLIIQGSVQPIFSNGIIPFILLGIVVGGISALYIASLEKSSVFFERFENKGLSLLVVASGVGAIAYFLPLQFEIHFDTTNRILSDNLGIHLLMALIVLRILTTALTLGAGFVGGNFFPGVTIGAATGVLVWKVLLELGMKLPSQSEMGILGTAAMVAGFMHAPLAGTVLAIEVSKNIGLTTPAMIVTAIAVTTSYVVYGRDIFSKAIGRLMIQSHQEEHKH